MTNAEYWIAPRPKHPLNACIEIPGSKSLSNRYLILAALGSRPVHIQGLLRSRDTDLMMEALRELGVTCQVEDDDSTRVCVTPASSGYPTGGKQVYCGLAGTVMRFVPALAMLADGPTRFYGDVQAQERPMRPLLDALQQLGATIVYEGQEGCLPFTIHPPRVFTGGAVDIDSSLSSQFISGLLLLGSRASEGLHIRHTGKQLPSLPHIRMTIADLREAGLHIDEDEINNQWTVSSPSSLPYPKLEKTVQIEPDLSNAAPFLGAALIAGGRVGVQHWPASTTQPGGLLPDLLQTMGANVTISTDIQRTCQVTGTRIIHGLGDYDLSAAGELVPSLSALLVFADSPSRLHGVGHLRGHETNRLEALTKEIQKIGGCATEMEDGIEITPVHADKLHPAIIETYHDHRMATFGALLGLGIPGIEVVNIATTRKTLPNFVALWNQMLQLV